MEVGVTRTTPHETVDDIGWRCTALHHIRVDVVLLRQQTSVAQDNRVPGAHTLHAKVSIQPPWVYSTKYLIQTHTPCQGQHTAPVGVQHKVTYTNTHSMSRSAYSPRGCTAQSNLYKHTLYVKVSIQPPWVYSTKYLIQTHTPCQDQHTAPVGVQHKVPYTNTHSMPRSAYSPRGCTAQCQGQHTAPVGVQHKVPYTNTHSMSRSAYSPRGCTAQSTLYTHSMPRSAYSPRGCTAQSTPVGVQHKVLIQTHTLCQGQHTTPSAYSIKYLQNMLTYIRSSKIIILKCTARDKYVKQCFKTS